MGLRWEGVLFREGNAASYSSQKAEVLDDELLLSQSVDIRTRLERVAITLYYYSVAKRCWSSTAPDISPRPTPPDATHCGYVLIMPAFTPDTPLYLSSWLAPSASIAVVRLVNKEAVAETRHLLPGGDFDDADSVEHCPPGTSLVPLVW